METRNLAIVYPDDGKFLPAFQQQLTEKKCFNLAGGCEHLWSFHPSTQPREQRLNGSTMLSNLNDAVC
ncbi:hypothetical protein AVEN_144572-1 [Araneus ventricosus]|uniref:Uncharacterized protein n=1 Tax=Araneus ventricosus TaxID=182803 RepID=A0A4Y2BZ77_ARAVE|nr:hypothetical protein AVEN_144572-1 [Araneus ventricosus]